MRAETRYVSYQSGTTVMVYLNEISSGVWLHVEAGSTPEFDAQGLVIAPDGENNLVRDLSQFLDVAKENNVFVVLCLFNGAAIGNDNYKNLVLNDTILQSYIDNALTVSKSLKIVAINHQHQITVQPIVTSLSDKPALGAWEIMNEPEGSIAIQSNANPCFDTTILAPFGGGWSGANVPMETMLRFVNRLTGAIKRADPKALVTVGSYSEIPQTTSFPGMFNYYQDHCLQAAGGDEQGIIDFYQMHTYAWDGTFGNHTPFRVAAVDYGLDKPLVIGEFSYACAAGETIEELWNLGYDLGYDGLWSWQYNNDDTGCMDTKDDQNLGMQAIRLRPGVSVVIHDGVDEGSDSLAYRIKSELIVTVLLALLAVFFVPEFL